MRLINADKLIEEIRDGDYQSHYPIYYINIINSFPTYVPKQGEWIIRQIHGVTVAPYTCSECGYKNNEQTNYCPNCGIKM